MEPQRRRLKVATDLFDTLIIEHVDEIGHGFLFWHTTKSAVAEAFIASLGFPAQPLAPDKTLVTLPQTVSPRSSEHRKARG